MEGTSKHKMSSIHKRVNEQIKPEIQNIGHHKNKLLTGYLKRYEYCIAVKCGLTLQKDAVTHFPMNTNV